MCVMAQLMTSARSSRRQRRDARQRPAAEELERRAAAGRDVRDAVGDAGLLDRRDRVAAADDRRALHRGHRLRDRRSCPAANASISNTPIGPFQTTVFASRDAPRVSRDRRRADVEPHPIADRRIVDVEHLGRRAGLELRRDDVIDRQPSATPRAFARAIDVARRVELVVLDQRLADRHAARLEERVGHRAADEQRDRPRPSRFSMTSILSDTFAPPRIATNGRSGSLERLPEVLAAPSPSAGRPPASRDVMRRCLRPTRARGARRRTRR